MSTLPFTRQKALQWGLVLVAFVVAIPLWHARGEASRSGDEAKMGIGLYLHDRGRLACALERTVQGYECAYTARGSQWIRAEGIPEEKLLAPYVTTTKTVVLVPGLFTMPELDRRYHERFRSGKPVPRGKPKAVQVECQVRLLDPVDRVYVRFGPKRNWALRTRVRVAVPLSCSVPQPHG